MTDEQIIDLFFARSEQGIRELDVKYGKFCRRLAYNMLDDAQIDREIVAEFVETRLLTDEQVMRAVVRREGKSFAHRLLDTLRGLIEKVKAALHIGNADAEQLKMLERGRDILAEVIRSEEAATDADGIAFSMVGKNKNGIEVYETSDAVKKLSYNERKALFLEVIKNQYKGRTARFVRNGHTYYALFSDGDIRKNIYGDKRSDTRGWKAKITAGADGDIFNLVENAAYNGSMAESGKNTSAHHSVHHWDYFIKTVQIDGRLYDLIANVRKTDSGEFVYFLQFNENKKAEAAPLLRATNGSFDRMLTASVDTSVSQDSPDVNSKYTQNSKNDADIDGFSVGGVETDSEGNALSEAQQEFFSGSLVTDEDGALLPVYHATDSAEFTVFDKSKLGYNTDGNTSDEGMAATAHVGFWFNTKNLTGEAGSRAEKVYLNLTNPYELTSLDVLAEEIKALGEGETPAEMGEAYATDLWLRGYDGIEIRHDEEFGGTSYVAFDENQIKRTTNKNPTKDADIRFSVGGIKAKTADVGRLADAERMEQGGADSETVRRETGWYRGYDGKWRFEIDDSKMRFINHREESRRTWKLDELIRHDALFAAYPELRNYTVLNFAFEDGINGVFSPGLNRIMLNPNLDRAGKRAALIHEIQHAIQVIEGFAAGSSTDYWQDAFVTDEEKRTERHLLELSRKNRLLEEDMYRLLEDTPDARRDALRATLVKRHGEKAVREFTDTYNHLLNLQKQREMRAEQAYRNTAGEIEAANVASRLSLSAKQRAETRPDIDRTNVRFSQSAGWHHAEYDPETAGIKEQLEHSAETLNAMRTVTSVEVPQNFTSKSEAAKWAIETLKRTGYQVDRQGYGVIHFNAKDINRGANYADTSAEKAALAALPAVLKKGIEIGGHANHKAREKQTVTFAAPIELNGIRGNMAVVVNKRGDHYYAHRIVLPDGKAFVFSEKNNATREPSRGVTVSGSLAETTSVASKNSISNSAENVNTILKKDAETDADIRFSVGGEQTDAGAEVSDADKRFAPVESAIKLLQGGADLWRTLRETGASPREIALRMATSGESDAAIRELTGLYRDALGVWTYDKAWFDAHVPDIADTRELRAGYKLGTVDEQMLGLAPEEVKASRRRLLDSAKLPDDADAARVRQTAYLERRIANEATKDAKSRTAAKKLLEAAEMVKLPDGMSKTQVAAAMADAQKVVALIFRPLRFALLASSATGGMMFSFRSKRCCTLCVQTGLCPVRAQKKKSKPTGLDFYGCGGRI